MSNDKLKQSIIQYINVDEQINTLEDKLKHLRKSRDQFEEHIIISIKENKIENKDIKIGQSILRYEGREVKDSLSQNLVKNSLINYFLKNYGDKNKDKCNEKALEIFEYILNSRETKTKYSLKRITSK